VHISRGLLVIKRLDAGETIIETIVLLKHPKLTSKIPKGKKIEALTKMICPPGKSVNWACTKGKKPTNGQKL
jgi:hypothetical protein